MKRLYINREESRPNAAEWAFIEEQLSTPFERLKFRQQMGSNFAAYADSREYYERFDLVVGSNNWQTHYEEISLTNTRTKEVIPDKNDLDRWDKPKKIKEKTHDEVLTGIKCTIAIFGVEKADIGTESAAESVKGAFSDSFKRASVQWGPGRYIYSLGYFTNKNPVLPEYAEYIEPFDYESYFSKVKDKIIDKANTLGAEYLELANANIEEAMSDYSEGVSLLQKERVKNYLVQIGRNLGTNKSYGNVYGYGEE